MRTAIYYIKWPVIFLLMGYVAGVIKCHQLSPMNFGPHTNVFLCVMWLLFSCAAIFYKIVGQAKYID